MRYLVLGLFGLWIYYAYGINMSEEMKLATKLFTIVMFWVYGMQIFSKQ